MGVMGREGKGARPGHAQILKQDGKTCKAFSKAKFHCVVPVCRQQKWSTYVRGLELCNH